MKKIIKLFKKCYQSISLFRLSLDENIDFTENLEIEKDFEFKVIYKTKDSEFLNYIIQERGAQYGETVNDRLITDNHLCFLFINKSDNESAYCRWLRLDSFFHEKYNKQIKLDKNEAFTLDSFTPVKYRGMGLHKEMNKRMLNYCKRTLNLKSIFMVIYNGSEYKHLHKTVYEMGYKKIKTRYLLTLQPIFKLFFK